MSGRITTGLDVGTTKVFSVIAEVHDGGGITVLGVGEEPSEGVDRGLIVGLDAAAHAVAASMKQAERMAGVSSRGVVAGISGDHVRSLNSTGVIGVSRKDRVVGPEDVERVLEAARAVAIPGDRELLHVLPRAFTVDDQREIQDPIGMTGVRLEAEVHMVTVQTTAMQNLLRAIERARVRVDSLILQPLAAAEAVLGADEKGLGVVLLDIGGGTTDIAVFEGGSVRHTAATAYGGRAISHDISVGLRTPLEHAERLKVASGRALAEGMGGVDVVEVMGVGGRESQETPLRQLVDIIEARAEEILELARTEVERVVDVESLGGGVVLTGGGSRLPDIDRLAERVFGMPSRLGSSEGVSGVSDLAFDPRLSVAIGLLQFAPSEGGRASTGVLGRVSRPVRDWFRTNFLS